MKNVATSSSAIKPSPEISNLPASLDGIGEQEVIHNRRRRFLLLVLFVLLVLLCSCCGLNIRYITRPAPLPDFIPAPFDISYEPHYLFSIYGLDKPVGVAGSPDGRRIYVTETAGERMIKAFDRDGNLIGSFAQPRTLSGERSPVYISVAPDGRVFVSDRIQHVLNIFSQDGGLLDIILSREVSLRSYIKEQLGSVPDGTLIGYNIFESVVIYQLPGDVERMLPVPELSGFSPLGVRIDSSGQLLLTDVTMAHNCVYVLPVSVTHNISQAESSAACFKFGRTGNEADQFYFPNTAVVDSHSRVYVSDGNNGRISTWDQDGNFLFNFGLGTGEDGISLPRGMFIDQRDRLFVVDAVANSIKVFDVSDSDPVFLYSFGSLGVKDGMFNFPNDIYVDISGRLYVADRENNRIQVWSY